MSNRLPASAGAAMVFSGCDIGLLPYVISLSFIWVAPTLNACAILRKSKASRNCHCSKRANVDRLLCAKIGLPARPGLPPPRAMAREIELICDLRATAFAAGNR
jgi:hypothetical protein